ncbi:MAG: hypothetical protein U1C55_08800 [Smithellaceae bacterium]|nr:hypothetical protein [Smithellaceae bacterium]
MYDLVVIGNDLSSQIAALTASRRGMNTALIRDSGLPCLHSPKGYSFSLDPFPPLGFESGQATARFLEKLDISPPQFAPVGDQSQTAIQVIMPEHRLDISGNREHLSEELGREFPKLGNIQDTFYMSCREGNDLIARLLDQIFIDAPHGDNKFFSYGQEMLAAVRWKTKLSPLRSLISRERSILNIIKSMGLMSSHLNINSISEPGSAYALALPFRSARRQQGGRAAFQLALQDIFSQSGKLLDEYSVMRIKAKKEITIDLAIDDSMETLKTRKLIISANWEKLPLFLTEQPFLRLNKSLGAIKPGLFLFTLHIGIMAKALPDMLAPYVMIVKGTENLPWLKEFIFLETNGSGNRIGVNGDRRELSATVFTTESPQRMSSESLREASGHILSTLSEFLPFSRDNIDYLDVEESISVSRKYQEMLNHRYEIKGPFPAGFGSRSHKTPHPDVFLSGRVLCPGLGYEGEVLSGMHAANLTMRKEG